MHKDGIRFVFKLPYRDAANGRLNKLEMLHDPAS